jgi:hypothetical protein
LNGSTIELGQCGVRTMHETAWEVFVRRHPVGQAFYEPGEPVTYQIDDTFFGADMNFPSLFSPLQVGPYKLQGFPDVQLHI